VVTIDTGQKSGVWCFGGEGAGSPSNIMWQGTRLPARQISSWSIELFGHNTPTSHTGQTDNGPIAQGEQFYKRSSKNENVLPLGAVALCATRGNATWGLAVTTTAGRLTRWTLDSMDELDMLWGDSRFTGMLETASKTHTHTHWFNSRFRDKTGLVGCPLIFFLLLWSCRCLSSSFLACTTKSA